MAAKVGPDEYRCPDCGQTRPHRDFYHTLTKRNRTSHYCRACHRKRQQEVRDIRRAA